MVPPIDQIGEAVVLAIAPFVPRLLNGLGEGAIKRAGSDAYDTAKALYQEIFTKKDSQAAQAALEQWVSQPESEARQQVLQAELTALMEREAALAHSLTDILAAAKLLPAQQSITVERADNSQISIGDGTTLNQTNIYQALSTPKPERTGELSNVPRGSDTFVGRDEPLKALHEQLAEGNAVAITAIQGMGGVGKTELARQYALQYKTAYPGGVCWLRVRDLDVASQIVEFAVEKLHLDPPQDLALNAQVAYCWSHWPGAERVLVVYDDVTDYARVAEVLPPQAERFCLLMTTRQQQLAVTVQPFPIGVLTEAAALELLRQIVGAERTEAELETARAICKWVGYLPLGLELVGQYLRQREVSFAVLLERLEAQRTEARALQNTYEGMTAERGVIAAFELSWQLVDDEAQQIACWLSLFALAPIPWETAESPVAEAEREDWEEGRDALVNLSLLQRLGAGSYQLHQLVREYFQVKLAQREDADEVKRAYCKRMVAIGQQIPDLPTRDLLLKLTPVMPHVAEAATSWHEWLGDEDNELAWPFVAMARSYEGQGAYTQAEPWYEECLKATQNRFGEDHPDVATSLNNLAALYRCQGRYEQARPLYVQALALRRKLLGEDHPDVATSLNNLAALYKSQGRYEQAEPLLIQALALRRQLLGEDHLNVANSLNNLADLYRSQGRYEQAEPLLIQAVALSRKLLGEDHLDVANSLNNLALLYERQGHYDQAEPLYEQALALRRKLLGEDHLDVANSLNNLAALYKSQGRYEQAKLLCVKALTLSRKLLGENHPDVATSINNLAALYESQGHYDQAEPPYVQALTLRRKLLGEDHPDVAASINNLAALYYSRGCYEQAEPLFVQALALRRKLLGEDHPDVATSLNNLAFLCYSQGRYEQAEPLFVQTLALRRKLLGEDHPDVAGGLNNLAFLCYSQGRYEQAEPLYVQALALRRKLLGEDHPDVASSLNNLATLYESQGHYEQTESLYLQAISILMEQLGQEHPNTQAVVNNFVQFIAAVVQVGRQGELSDHPATQHFIESVQSQ
ncbi:tetratricopeptide repeat protein [Leptolyngbya sp. BC1307]|uniref:tetratricopeptide repeat protein n=1 Tax=Leptolyngbya sp. BC1307 TaxID=2029589 RepID=UPI00197EA6D3|nr:tetratricopeptide repeat protein [Leptolyngbya sp. BC1307]